MPQPTEIGIKHCGNKRCLLCCRNYLQLTDKIISPIGKLLFTIKCNFSCKSKNILYYMTCTICGKDYVGQTNDFRKRMNNHKSNIRGTPTKDTIPVDEHIHYCQLNTHQTFNSFATRPVILYDTVSPYCNHAIFILNPDRSFKNVTKIDALSNN